MDVIKSAPCSTATSGPDVDLMVTEEVIDDTPVVEFGSEEVKTTSNSNNNSAAATAGQPPKKSKILVTLSDDLSYTLTIDGETLSSVMDSIAVDDYMKNEWNSWQRFIQNPKDFFVYIFDDDFHEYVIYRPEVRIRHLSKIKIKNKFYVNQTFLKKNYHQLMESQSPAMDDCFDAEPTDALIGDQNNNSTVSGVSQLPNPWVAPITSPIATPIASPIAAPQTTILSTALMRSQNKDINTSDIISHNTSKASQYHHNYHMSSPSAPTSQLSSIRSHTAVSAKEVDAINTTVRSPNSSQSSKLTKAAKKLFINEEPKDRNKSKSSDTDSLNGDLLADAPTGPTFDWTQEQTIAFLELCKNFSKELAPKRSALEVKPSIWEQLAKELNTKDFGYSFDALMCRNHFSRLRLTYTNVLCYPTLRDESRWPYFEIMKEIIGEKPEEIQSKVKTRAQYKSKLDRPGLAQAIKRTHRKPARNAGDVMKNSANQEVSELYVALLNLVKKYMKYFETEKKNRIWTRIETEMAGAGYKWTANALRGLFYRLRYTYIKILRNVGEERASATWPYFRYFHGLDLKAFPCRKTFDLKNKKGVKKRAQRSKVLQHKTNKVGRRPGRPRKPTTAPSSKVSESQASEQNQNTHPDYSDGQNSGSDLEGVENKRKKTETG